MELSPSSGFSSDISDSVSEFSSSEVNAELLLESLAERAMRLTGATGVGIARREGHEYVCVAAVGETSPTVGVRFDGTAGITGECIRTMRPVVCENAQRDSRVTLSACEELGIRSIAAVPICKGDKCLGVLEAFASNSAAFESSTVEILERLATSIAAQWKGQPYDDVVDGDTHIEEGHISSDKSVLLTHDGDPSPGAMSSDAGRGLHLGGTTLLEQPDNNPALLKRVIIGGMLALAVITTVYWPTHTSLPKTAPAEAVAELPLRSIDSLTFKEPLSPTLAAPRAQDIAKTQLDAKAGDRSSQLKLANALAEGKGIAKDIVAAHAWYIVANRNNRLESTPVPIALAHSLSDTQVAKVRTRVAQMFEQGVGAPKDLVSSYYWLLLAESAGSMQAHDEQQRLARLMQGEQIKIAETRAKTWLLQHHQKPSI